MPEIATPSDVVLDVRGLTKNFGGLAAVRAVDLSIERGSVHAIIGPNGAGKTTVFNCITAFVKPSGGTVVLDGARIDGLPAHVVAAHGIARTYQNVRLFANMTAIENVMVGLHRRLSVSFWGVVLRTPAFRHEEDAAREQSRAMLDFVGIPHRAGTLARNMPYGDQRRLEIARALVSRPTVLMLDEPAAGMNPAEGVALVHLIERIRSELGITVILIEHHMRVVMAIADRITVFDRGAVLTEGTPAEIQSDERVITAYLGRRATAADVRTVERLSEEESVA
ncbi:amino acid/amide ABC transporter ATP-binding protein 1, HAAT family (TC 3.A.1.4.-) [Pseudoxanthobacter soli DSM 19599]|uniref:Amino acid/amide ABC transporter ATP-binding protein 1, HAAT family (TC 3.A.1.4.-) n=1 Tax=Pseudoxanthobacter soli DSM 19599 TaxID=1123029 RepID=A0A1M7ZRG4_9HYPH|nr:ABC transporter ATP-binding protein [Pseudoxanthobacter soli]SHO67475.1 amino acid/amide ABC transporter ATP-binding protein 1, HAAT family (TC 3.A.1.4.-) [Pseudoxanthobacter soli DSM 19599]